MKKIIINLIVIASAIGAHAQKIDIKPLHIGDKIPDLTFLTRSGDKVKKIHLSDFKGKLLILDYWGIICGDCIESMPRMLELQEHYKDKIQIIFFTNDKESDIKKVLNKNKNLTPKVLNALNHLLFIDNDTQLLKLFPTKEYGIETWIDTNQVFRFSTAETTTIENVQAFLNGNMVNLNNFVFPDITPINRASWLDKRIGFRDHLLSYSIFTKFDNSFGNNGALVVERDSVSQKNVGLNMLNSSICDFYISAYLKTERKRIIILLEVNDSDKYVYPQANKYVDWRTRNEFCYALKIKSGELNDVFNLMKNDLDHFFQLDSKMEVRRVKCLILKRISLDDKIKTRGLGSKYEYIADGFDGHKLIIQNQLMSRFVFDLWANYTPYGRINFIPFIDETNYKGKIDIEIPWRAANCSIPVLRKSLQAFGLDLVEDYRNMEVLILKERDYKGPDLGKVTN